MRCMLLLFVAYYTIPASLGSNGNLHLSVSQEFVVVESDLKSDMHQCQIVR